MPVTYKKIASVTVGSGGASTIDIQNIPATYTDLILKFSMRTNQASVNYENVKLELNNSGGTAYSDRIVFSNGSVASSAANSSQPVTYFQYATSAGATASTFSNTEIYIPNYAGSTNKSLSVDSVTENNAAGAIAGLAAELWANTAAITRIKLIPNGGGTILEYSTATLYGISKS